ncbi:TerD family protein [Streptomyces sp. NBC_01476]|uniref:TerD family protein n=1 Tax=Streptomyces sp. NBC_01476 TaxID=2903881 RepID=UPI002E360272|nr:TerD family protein [Streptomyces sp. NBC_01476]
MHSLNKGTEKVEVQLKWDPSPLGAPDSDLDLIAATYLARDPGGEPAYLVYFDSRSPDGTITLNRDSKNGKGLGIDESMTLELHRLGADYGRVIVGVAIQQNGGRLVFADVLNPEFRVMEGYTELSGGDFAEVAGATAATVAEFVRTGSGVWEFHPYVRGFDTDPNDFALTMGRRDL